MRKVSAVVDYHPSSHWESMELASEDLVVFLAETQASALLSSMTLWMTLTLFVH